MNTFRLEKKKMKNTESLSAKIRTIIAISLV